ncbi:MAG: M14 family metallopeptidase [Pseudoxanthomonas suwonensis]|nr:M14 family metallopeptidase [Pseudoxanthomonas suwonensis]
MRAAAILGLLACLPLMAAAQDARWQFPEDGVEFDATFEGARLNGVERLGAFTYRLHVTPETSPINPSPWYGFEVRTRARQVLDLTMVFDGYRPRYTPWISRDAQAWDRVDLRAYRVDREADAARLLLRASQDAMRVSAQPPVLEADIQAWTSAVADRVPTRRVPVATSVRGRPIEAMLLGNTDARDVVLVLGRQHPPETTGMRALFAFVDALTADSPAARAFRERHLVVVVPLMNPDGVAAGHWRTNSAGTDLNRDWGPFAQPETRGVAEFLAQLMAPASRRMAFALDFHSTWYDIFYTVTEDPARRPGGVLNRWMAAMDARYPGRIEERPSAASSAVFKNWVFREYGAPSVTYEVGDTTEQASLHELATFAAESLMQELTPRQ